MANNIVSEQLIVSGMTCVGCESRIERRLMKLEGVIKVDVDCASGRLKLKYDNSKVSLEEIKQAVIALNYGFSKTPAKTKPAGLFQLAVVAIILLGISVLIKNLGWLDFFNYFPEAQEGMSLVMVFLIGLFTSVHCVGMCGGINLSQCMASQEKENTKRLRPSFLYNAGRLISYSIIGGLAGTLGSVISFNGIMRGAVALFAGIFMIIMGLNMLNIFPWLKALKLRLPVALTKSPDTPLYIGILNGFMPCGPLQAMQLYALSTGSPLLGAVSMLLFALGTTPLMFGFGAAGSLLSKKFTAKVMQISAILVIILGVGMFNTGISMSGFLAPGTKTSSDIQFEPVIVDGYQIVEIDVSPRGYAPITVKKGIPVKFNLRTEQQNLNGCNYAIMIPAYNIQTPLNPGDNIVEFMPTETGRVGYSCWMNMIRSSITIVD